ncbi:aminoglycoside 6'-N-acetyltransferase [Devosia faecipullorum]|uniref:aminoglycoside 6'-N-acetyltransferase n=1 Tax=Devosia faecipullorum TaxID=2755039 RepID=UPI0038B339EC
MRIAAALPADAGDWLALRTTLWPRGAGGDHENEIMRLLANAGDTINLLARTDAGEAMGFAEASLRRDYVNGCRTSPVAFLEGIYVLPAARGRGVARALVTAVEDWGRAQGCTEFASDASLDNVGSHAMHRALGFEETQRVVFFRKALDLTLR